MFSPHRDQPHYICKVVGPVGAMLASVEQALPGVLAYGHHAHSREWNRLVKLQEANPGLDLDAFAYYRCFVPVNCMAMFEAAVVRDATMFVEEAVNAGDIFAWPGGSDEDLQTMAAYGRDIVRSLVDRGVVRPFVADFVTDYQARGVYWAATRPFAKFVYPCGSGKTLTALLAASERLGPVAVVAPAKARQVWWEQVQEYTNLVPHRVIPEGQRRRGDETLDEYLEKCADLGMPPVVIFGAQALPDLVDQVAKMSPTALIFDELHTFGQAKRWVAIHGSNGEVAFEKKRTTTNTREVRAVAAMDVSRLPSLQLRIGLTATPLDDGRPRRLWSQLDLLNPGGFGMGFSSFAKRYCDAREGDFGGIVDTGSSHIDELKARASFMIQEVTHTESHGQLPATRVQVVWLDPSDQDRPAAFRKVINAAEKQALKTHTEFDQERALEANLMEAASRKRSYVLAEALEGLRGGGKVVLFTARRQDCEDWASFISKALDKEVKNKNFDGAKPQLWWGHGGTDDRERAEMVSAFRRSDGPCILVATGQAFGESVDGLQTADLAIFAMLPWRPGDFEQWKGRFDRLGGRATLLKVVLARMTYDEKVAGILADKIAPIRDFLTAEQYRGLDNKLLGLDDRVAMRASILKSLFGATA